MGKARRLSPVLVVSPECIAIGDRGDRVFETILPELFHKE